MELLTVLYQLMYPQVHIREVDRVPVRRGHPLAGGSLGRARRPRRPLRLQHAQARAARPRRRPQLGRPLAGGAKGAGRREILQLQVHMLRKGQVLDLSPQALREYHTLHSKCNRFFVFLLLACQHLTTNMGSLAIMWAVIFEKTFLT